MYFLGTITEVLCHRPHSGCGQPGYQCRQLKSKMEVVYKDASSPATVRNITISIGCSCVTKCVDCR